MTYFIFTLRERELALLLGLREDYFDLDVFDDLITEDLDALEELSLISIRVTRGFVSSSS